MDQTLISETFEAKILAILESRLLILKPGSVNPPSCNSKERILKENVVDFSRRVCCAFNETLSFSCDESSITRPDGCDSVSLPREAHEAGKGSNGAAL